MRWDEKFMPRKDMPHLRDVSRQLVFFAGDCILHNSCYYNVDSKAPIYENIRIFAKQSKIPAARCGSYLNLKYPSGKDEREHAAKHDAGNRKI